jgi:hypothetical protein
MRTDPRADEVRNIVERVFSDYRRHKLRRRETAGAGGRGRTDGVFPRIFRPWDEEMPDREELDLDDLEIEELEIDETILIDEGRYVARSYRTPGYMAMWLVSVGIVQFYDDQGRMLVTINLFDALRPQRLAA